ncbi:MAG: T9SS type A sorting domain-containing protein, partial [Ignavibacteriae bacterium]|nr:T9SS type A sorting domain-containing protein [Ignavibacteriota bacterium]
DQSTGWLASYYDYLNEGKLRKTTDGGNNWITLYTYDDDIFNSVFFINQNTGWLASYYDYINEGKLRKTTNGGVGIDPIGNKIPETYKLFQNYPNPFNPSTSIKFDLSGNENVTLKIFDLNGKEIAVLINEKLESGSYLLIWNASQYPSGIYFYKLQTEKFVETKKMVLIK